MARPPITVRRSGIEGRGAYASRRIRGGDWIIQYTGERISNEEADRRYDDDAMDRHHTFLFVVDEHGCLDAAVGGNAARYINHSCEPNCEAVLAEGKAEIWIVALRDIEAGEELTYDYGYEIGTEDDLDEARRRYPCHCASPNCRGTILRLRPA